jgi:hypothetical protein
MGLARLRQGTNVEKPEVSSKSFMLETLYDNLKLRRLSSSGIVPEALNTKDLQKALEKAVEEQDLHESTVTTVATKLDVIELKKANCVEQTTSKPFDQNRPEESKGMVL